MPNKTDPVVTPEQDEAFDTTIDGSGSDETALATVDSTVVAARVYLDNPSFRANEVALPRLRLAQGLTQEVSNGEAKPGDWVLLGHEAHKEVTFVPLKFNRHRERRVSKVGGGTELLCSSGDAEIGVGNPGGNCLTCQFAQWTPSKTVQGKNDPPQCKLGYSWVGYSVTHEAVVELTVRASTKASQTAAQYINTMIANLGLGRFAVNLNSSQEKSSSGTYFAPVVQKVPVAPDVLEVAREAIGVPVPVE